jgi:cytochrome c-type biogenesis protein CcmH/NrfG
MIAQGSLAEAQSTTFLIRARQAYFNGNYDRALDQILQSIAQNPNNPQAYAMLGSLYYAVDWKQLAVKYWEKSLTLDPENREIQELVAKVRSNPNF